jgi:hypothetical protein
MTMGRFVTIGGQIDGSRPHELIVHRTGPDGRPVRVDAPPGECWDAAVAVRGDMIAATTHSITDPATPPRLYTITDANGVRPVPLPPIHHGSAIDVRVWPLDPASHVLGISAGPGNNLVTLTAGVTGRPRHRRVVHSRTPTAGTVLVEDGEHGIHRLRAADISADGTRLALAYTGDGGATLDVAVMPVSGGPPRVLWQRPAEWDDPEEVRLSFDQSGRHLLLSHGEVIAIALADATHRVLTPTAANRWRRAAW